MLRLLWKCVLEVLPPTCATVVAGVLLSAYHDHILALQNIIDPRASLEQVAPPTPEGGKQQAVTAPQVPVERAADPAGIDSKSPAPAPDASSTSPAGEGVAADGNGKTSETKTPEVSDPKAAPAGTTDVQAAQLNAVLMASSPMSQPPAEIKATQPPDTKAAETTVERSSEGPPADGQSAGPVEPVAPVPATDVSPTPAKLAVAKAPDTPTATPVTRPGFSRHVAKPARKATVVKMESERLPPRAIAMVPLPPPAAPPIVAMEPPPQVSPSRSTVPSHALPPPLQAPAAPQVINPMPPQAIGPTSPPIGLAPGVAAAAEPTGSQPSLGAPQGGINASQDGVAKTSEPPRVFGVPIPSSIAAVGGALDPRPVFSAGQKAFEKIVITAKSVVPDFGHEQEASPGVSDRAQ